MGNVASILNLTVQDGGSVTLESGFIWAAINPSTSDTSFTITNSLPAIPDKNEPTSGPITTPFSFGVCPNAEGWAQHTVTATGGIVYIAYVRGN